MHKSLINEIRQSWSKFESGVILENNEFELDKFPFLKQLENSNLTYAVLNNVKFEIEYHGSNFFDVLGIDKDAFDQFGTKTIVESVNKNQSSFLNTLPKYFKEFWEYTDEEKKKDITRVTVGLNVDHINKGIIRLVVQTYILEVDLFQIPTHLLVVYNDVTYMLKDDFYWIRFSGLEEGKKVLVYHDGFKDVLKKDILSVREKEILKLLMDGKSSLEIAEILFISKITVNNHRQNMLNRFGVKDTTGLITIAILCQLL